MFENMGKNEIKQSHERTLLEAKIEDQYRFAISRNKITHTDFLNETEIDRARKFLRQKSFTNYEIFGGYGERFERHILLFFPEKFSSEMVEKNREKILCGLRIELPKDLHYEHRIYLSGVLKLGIKREKMGDILVQEKGADLIILKEVADFLQQQLTQLTRFQKARCEIISLSEIRYQEKKFEDLVIVVSSMRLDNVISELAKVSRTGAEGMLKAQKVLVNHEIETKVSRKINEGDCITIRGKGKFIVEELERKTRSERQVVRIKK